MEGMVLVNKFILKMNFIKELFLLFLNIPNEKAFPMNVPFSRAQTADAFAKS